MAEFPLQERESELVVGVNKTPIGYLDRAMVMRCLKVAESRGLLFVVFALSEDNGDLQAYRRMFKVIDATPLPNVGADKKHKLFRMEV